jgi:tetratricopeptide (TPR) repeat protein
MGKFKLKITKTQIVGAAWVVALLVAFAAIGMLAWWLQNKDKSSSQPDLSTANARALPEAVSEAQKQAVNGKPEDAVRTIQDALSKPNVSNDEKQMLYVEQGVAYGNSGQHQKALESYIEADKIKSDSNTSHLIAESYEALGNKAEAIKYYKKTLTQLDKSSIGYQSDKTYFESKVTSLGGTL